MPIDLAATPACEAIIAYQSILANEAIAAAAAIGGDRRNVAILAVISANWLNADWHAPQRARLHGDDIARSHTETLLANIPHRAGLVTAIDAHSVTLDWLGSVLSHRTTTLGVEHFGQTGTINDLYAHFGIGAQAIETATRSFTGRRA